MALSLRTSAILGVMDNIFVLSKGISVALTCVSDAAVLQELKWESIFIMRIQLGRENREQGGRRQGRGTRWPRKQRRPEPTEGQGPAFQLCSRASIHQHTLPATHWCLPWNWCWMDGLQSDSQQTAEEGRGFDICSLALNENFFPLNNEDSSYEYQPWCVTVRVFFPHLRIFSGDITNEMATPSPPGHRSKFRVIITLWAAKSLNKI